jgi:protein TonB
VTLHGALLAALTAYSFGKVEELSSPRLAVTFLRLPTFAPLAPPPPSASKAAPAPVRPKPGVVQPPATVQTSEPVVPEPVVAEAEVPEAQEDGSEDQRTETGGEDHAADGAAGAGPAPAAGSVPSPAPPPRPPEPPKPPELAPEQRRTYLDRYLQESLRSRVASRFRYPPEAEREGAEGTVLLRLRIDAAGKLIKVTVIGICPHAILCDAARTTVQEAAPFPPPPRALGGTIEVDMPLAYRLE